MPETNHHDLITKKVLSNKTYAADFLKNTLPSKIASKLNFSRLKIEKGDFIDSEDKERFTDLLYSVPIINKGEWLGIFCLVEHKSYKDKNIHLQLLSYLAGIYQKHKYPVIPIVLYHGKKEWDIPVNFASSLKLPDDLRESLVKYIPDFQYELMDLRSDKTDGDYFSVVLQAFLMSLRDVWHLSDRSRLEALFKDYFKPFYEGKFHSHKKVLDDLFRYIMNNTGRLTLEIVVELAVKYISQDAGDKMITIAEQLEQKGIEKGKTEGITEGMEKGKTERSQEIALGMLNKGYSVLDIRDITGLSEETIKDLKHSLS